MRTHRWFAAIALVAAFGAGAPRVRADLAWRTRLRLAEATEVPGTILPPGVYVVRTLDTQRARTIVQFTDADERRVFATVIGVPEWEGGTAERTRFSYFQRFPGGPPAIKTWVYPGNETGIRFVYPRSKTASSSAAESGR